jgi:hypothetical protein
MDYTVHLQKILHYVHLRALKNTLARAYVVNIKCMVAADRVRESKKVNM